MPVRANFLMKQTNTFLFAIVVTAGIASGASPKISVDPETMDPANTVDVIVQYKQAPTEVHQGLSRNNHSKV